MKSRRLALVMALTRLQQVLLSLEALMRVMLLVGMCQRRAESNAAGLAVLHVVLAADAGTMTAIVQPQVRVWACSS